MAAKWMRKMGGCCFALLSPRRNFKRLGRKASSTNSYLCTIMEILLDGHMMSGTSKVFKYIPRSCAIRTAKPLKDWRILAAVFEFLSRDFSWSRLVVKIISIVPGLSVKPHCDSRRTESIIVSFSMVSVTHVNIFLAVDSKAIPCKFNMLSPLKEVLRWHLSSPNHLSLFPHVGDLAMHDLYCLCSAITKYFCEDHIPKTC